MEPWRAPHPEPLLLQSFADGQLNSDEFGRVQRHLWDCADCRRQVQEFNALAAELRGLADLPLRLDFRAQVEADLRPRRRAGPLPWLIAVQLLAGLAVLVGAWPLLGQLASSLRPLPALLRLDAWRLLSVDWAAPAQALLSSFGRALQFQLPTRLPSWDPAQVAAAVGVVAVVWAIGNALLLRRAAETHA